MRGAAGPVGVAVFAERFLEHPAQDLGEGLLDHSVQHRRDAQRPLAAVLLRDERPSHRRRLVASRLQRGDDALPMELHVRREVGDRHPVDAGRPAVGPDPMPRGIQVFRTPQQPPQLTVCLTAVCLRRIRPLPSDSAGRLHRRRQGRRGLRGPNQFGPSCLRETLRSIRVRHRAPAPLRLSPIAHTGTKPPAPLSDRGAAVRSRYSQLRNAATPTPRERRLRLAAAAIRGHHLRSLRRRLARHPRSLDFHPKSLPAPRPRVFTSELNAYVSQRTKKPYAAKLTIDETAKKVVLLLDRRDSGT